MRNIDVVKQLPCQSTKVFANIGANLKPAIHSASVKQLLRSCRKFSGKDLIKDKIKFSVKWKICILSNTELRPKSLERMRFCAFLKPYFIHDLL